MKQAVLITGASGGIGYELAQIFAREKHDLVLVARRSDRLIAIKQELEAKYNVEVKVICKDLTVKDAAVEIYDELSQASIPVEILVNNAGYGDFGFYVNADWEKQYNMIQLNIVALMQMTQLFVKPMIERRSGKIMNVASTAAFQPGPFLSAYSASKAFVLSFSEALSKEVEKDGITVTALCPGPTETGFESAASLEASRVFKTIKPVPADAVAQFGYNALMRGKTVAVYGFINRLMVIGVRIAPRSLIRQIMYNLQSYS